MIEIESRELADIPVLHAYPVGQKDTPLPCAIFYHGFTSSSLVYSYFAVALAQAGLRVIMPDAPDHGSRFSGDAARRLNQFWQILLQSMQEFTTLRAAIAEENWLRDDRLAVGRVDGRDDGTGNYRSPPHGEMYRQHDGIGLFYIARPFTVSTADT